MTDKPLQERITQQKWHVDGFALNCVIVQRGENKYDLLARCDVDVEEWQANAELIAMAPDLLRKNNEQRDLLRECRNDLYSAVYTITLDETSDTDLALMHALKSVEKYDQLLNK